MRPFFLSLILLPVLSMAQVLDMAPKPDTYEQNGFTERVMVGLFAEKSSISDFTSEFLIMNQPYSLEVDPGNHFGLIGLLPLNPWITLTAQASYQKLSFQFQANNPQLAYQHINDSTIIPKIDSSDVQGSFNTHNVMAQLGVEAGIPLYSSQAHSLLFKFYSFGTGMGGKMFFDETKFESGNLWGYSWGGGLRIHWNRVAIMGGVRNTHSYWRTYFDPSEKTGDQSKEDTFMLDYDANFNPFVSVLFAFN